MNLYQVFLSGGPVMWPLLLCSFIALTVVIERAMFWRKLDKNRDRTLMDEILTISENGNWEDVRDKSSPSKDHIIRILVVGILHRDYDMGRAMEAEAESMVQRMQGSMTVLDTLITIAPLLGIFGTVVGIINSFEMLAIETIADPKLVTAGIAQALLTTASGLGIAIVVVIPYNYFNARIAKAIHTMEKYATSLEVVYKTGKTREHP